MERLFLIDTRADVTSSLSSENEALLLDTGGEYFNVIKEKNTTE